MAEQEVDFLEVDRPIPGQNYVCLSFISPDKILEDEAYRIMSRLPQVQPGEYLGKKVSVLYGLPISFRLN